MLFKSAITFLCLIVITHSATIKSRNIPVEVKYEETENVHAESVEGGGSNAVRNLDAKVQLSPEELKDLSQKSSEEINQPQIKKTEEKPTAEQEKLKEISTTLASIKSVEKKSEDQKEVVPELAIEKNVVTEQLEEKKEQGKEELKKRSEEQPQLMPEVVIGDALTTEQSVDKKEPMKGESKKEDEKEKPKEHMGQQSEENVGEMEKKLSEKREISEASSNANVGEKNELKEVSKETVTVEKKLDNEKEPQKFQEADKLQTLEPTLPEQKPTEETPTERPEGKSQEQEIAQASGRETKSETNAKEENNIENKPAEVQPKPESGSVTFSSLIQQAKDIIKSGFNELKESLKTEEGAPKPEQWDSLETTVNTYLNEENKQTESAAEKPEAQSLIQKIKSQFQSLTDDFLKTLGGEEGSTTQSPDVKPTEQGRENNSVTSEQGGTPCGAVTGFIQIAFKNIQNSLNNLAQESSSSTTSVPSIDKIDSTTTVPSGSRNLQDPVAPVTQDQIALEGSTKLAELSSTTTPDLSTESTTSVKLDDTPQKIEDSVNSEEIPSSDESRSSSSEIQAENEDQSANSTTESSREIINETTTFK